MGLIQDQETHVRRSSSMSFALRWKHENLAKIILIITSSLAMTFMFLLLLYGTAIKQITLVVNGQESVVQTRQWELDRLLDERSISVNEHDRIAAPIGPKLKNGDRIVINHTKPVQLTADGTTETKYTTGKTVAEALKDLNVSLGELDKTVPSLESALDETTPLQVIRVKKETEQLTETIPFEVVKRNDAQLLKGKEQVVQDGQEGVLLKTKEKIFEDGKLVSESVIEEKTETERVDKIVAVGTKNPVIALSTTSPNMDEVTKNGVKFGYKQIVKNMTLTAYTAGTGGKTYTGTGVTEGRTIAVDPKVVPLGWWVYIEGIGFRRAEDIGSAVKGNIIDIYFDSRDYASRFGLKRGYTVYIIGPKKPTVD
ncbi:3D domain-containing protein [Paenibacillus thalictri]|uniref:DUF348 domain-containing protein n=1 Tax=Paenibacillus thalictri TaxID=2527873 RepID=A0A4Q9DD51_9BACL|nr:DUF348 domain-containing protein [Paenibacillus thalictri]